MYKTYLLIGVISLLSETPFTEHMLPVCGGGDYECGKNMGGTALVGYALLLIWSV